MKLLKQIKQYLNNIVIESIEEYSVCKWHFKEKPGSISGAAGADAVTFLIFCYDLFTFR